ncbi:hypothetical protein [Thermoleophilum album]|uniref:Peptidase M28 domain-containing protein n=1 Tax=Thermoleophilum album TaxID=29539 RepID=A0A1H6FM17_THEAL|nr:hypothetical protein [Thermoleophilum album]SEH11250.1 hypothetical protein SAMN02745716_0706 [Thermoleophilum album]
MLEPRLYRAALAPAVVAAVVAMFSLARLPAPFPQGLAADVLVDGRLVAQEAARIAARFPDRRAGTAGDQALATDLAGRLSELGFDVVTDRFQAAGKRLVNVVARRPGRSEEALMLIASRDAWSRRDRASAADTAALLAMAQVLAGRPTHRALIIASVDGRATPAAVDRLLDTLAGEGALPRAAVAISDIGVPRRFGTPLVVWSSDDRRTSAALERTARASLREESDEAIPKASTAGQVARLALPTGVGAQARLIAAGVDAIRISGSGELAPPPSDRERIDADRVGILSRTALRTLTAMDLSSSLASGPGKFVSLLGRVLPGWVVYLLAGSLLVPPLLAATDALARARRQGQRVRPGVALVLAYAAPLVCAFLVLRSLAALGAFGDLGRALADPSSAPPSPFAGLSLLFALALALVVAVALRPLRRGAGVPGAGVGVALTLVAAGLLCFALNPYALVLWLPALHLWVLSSLTAEPSSARAPLWLLGLGLLLPFLALLHLALRTEQGVLESVWYALLASAGALDFGVAFLSVSILASGLALHRQLRRATSFELRRPVR